MGDSHDKESSEESYIKTQLELDKIAATLEIKYQILLLMVEDNLSGGRALYSASISLTNKSELPFGYSNNGKQWAIYFSHQRMVEPLYLPLEDSVDLEYAGVRFSHLNGCIFRLSPLKNFATLKKDESCLVKFNAQHYSASKSDVLPNWYIVVKGLEPRIIQSTEGESLSFVGPFDTPKRYKRFDYRLASGKRRKDTYQPFTPEVRFSRYPDHQQYDSKQKPIIPTPKDLKFTSNSHVDISQGDWKIIDCSCVFDNEAKYLSEKTGISISTEQLSSEKCDEKPAKIIALREKRPREIPELEKEAYRVLVDGSAQYIEISGAHPAGIFYGIQSLLSLSAKSSTKPTGRVPSCEVTDSPRYPFRGMHADVSRNFQTKEEIKRLLEAMAAYKLNKFHFHLTDDEGWRLEIPGLDELTEIGSKRGHDIEENSCLLPLLGSGPSPSGLGCGYYTVQDYKEILHFAKKRHIEVIPEIDMPGHSHAAVRAMRVRYDKLMEMNKKEEAEKYLLSDPAQNSNSTMSVQMMTENSMNPGLESAYVFVDKVIQELQEMHKDIQPLRIFHLGGDEVPFEVWEDSPACLALLDSEKVEDTADLMEYFVTRVGEVAHKRGLELGAWQDGIVTKSTGPYERRQFPNSNVLVHFWRNVWETGHVFDAFKLANNGYEVVMSPGTHLYFDHPYEPDPEERGLYWACRFVDTHKVFSFVPDNLLSNADVKITGEKLTKLDLRLLHDSEDFVELREPHNIKGLQGQIWTELVRTPHQFHAMIFPRILALAERAWHKASWENMEVADRKDSEWKDWSAFSHAFSHKEAQRLEDWGIHYHIPPPGARVSGDGLLEMRSCYPGLPMLYSVDEGKTWQSYTQPIDVTLHEHVFVKSSSQNAEFFSRVTSLEVKSHTEPDWGTLS